MNRKSILLILFVSLILFGCVEKKVEVKDYYYPEGFAVYSGQNRAVSPEGVMYRVITKKNEPFVSLEFWKEAMKKRMIDTGYTFLKDSDITKGKKKGYLLELSAPFGELDYNYMIAIFLKDKDIIIIEAAGDVKIFDEKRENIINAVKENL